ncbi:hypothetical protein K431DRAFT_264708 [Polychaeton citri CBS 116435]|uniref:Vacuolar sorting protein Vps3844 C-terminal domain-containing protein n=1 Tax=Polychaeton citri CBS 116435 TaxID=1314669 RepID=A0A9P4QE61_9PEZI|nr:hypothetical protein K431DRAFT_264708 [Polychaeton citri CBS 116435]
MRLQNSITALLCAAHTASARYHACVNGSPGCVIMFDPDEALTNSSILDPQVARLVLAQRVGAEDFHLSKELGQTEIDAINKYGVKNSLFGQSDSKSQVMLFYETTEEDPEFSAPQSNKFFLMTSPPRGNGLFEDFSRQSQATFKKVESLDELKSEYRKFTEVLKSHVTVLITPKLSAIEESSWGTYEMPQAAQSPLNKRQSTKEEPLSELPADTVSSAAAIHSTSTPVSSLFAEGEPLRGILPSCFRSESSCESSTRNCSGHGLCYLQFTDKSAEGAVKPECWKCQCKASKSDGGKKTTYWGGAACQKKDISTSFWLIALFVIGMVFLISFAVGSIWNMGQEDLPSVIGAGVSGPPKR